MEKNSCTDRVRKEVLHRAKKGGNILRTIKRRKANWISQTLRRNFVLKHVIEEMIERRMEVKRRPGRRGKQLLDDLK
jgi:hypothetical protein